MDDNSKLSELVQKQIKKLGIDHIPKIFSGKKHNTPAKALVKANYADSTL